MHMLQVFWNVFCILYEAITVSNIIQIKIKCGKTQNSTDYHIIAESVLFGIFPQFYCSYNMSIFTINATTFVMPDL